MNINIKLTEEQKVSVKQSIISEVMPVELANDLFGKIAMTGEDTDVVNNLKSTLIAYIKECKHVR